MFGRDSYIERMKLQLDVLNARMGAIDSNAHAAKHAARAQYKTEIDKLKQSRLAVTRLTWFAPSGAGIWQTLVVDLKNFRDACSHSFYRLLFQVAGLSDRL